MRPDIKMIELIKVDLLITILGAEMHHFDRQLHKIPYNDRISLLSHGNVLEVAVAW